MWGFILDWIIIYFGKLCQHWAGLWPDSNGFPEAHIALGALKQWDEDQDPRSPSEVWTSSSCPQVVRALKPDSSFHIMTNYLATREHRIWPKQNSEVSLGWGLRSKSYIYECTIIPCLKSRWHEYVHQEELPEDEVSWIFCLLWWTLGSVIFFLQITSSSARPAFNFCQNNTSFSLKKTSFVSLLEYWNYCEVVKVTYYSHYLGPVEKVIYM